MTRKPKRHDNAKASPVRISIQHNLTEPFFLGPPKGTFCKSHKGHREFVGKSGYITRPIKNGRDIQRVEA